MEQRYTVNLVKPNRIRVASELGQKGDSLIKLATAGFPVPSGFILKTTALNRYTANIRLDGYIQLVNEKIKVFSEETIHRLSKRIREMFVIEEFPFDIETELSALMSQIKSTCPIKDFLVAIRPSMNVTKNDDESYKDLYLPRLNVASNMASIIRAIIDCWSDLYSEEAFLYRQSHNIPLFNCSISLIIQVMIPSQVSGIVESCNKKTNSREHIVLDAILGLGEVINDPITSPDHYVILKHGNNSKDWYGLDIFERRISHQKYALYSDYPLEGYHRVELNERGNESCLKDENVYNIGKYAVDIEAEYNRPIRIEFCLYNNNIYFVQVTPIAGLVSIPTYMDPLSPVHDNIYRCLISIGSIFSFNNPISPAGIDMMCHCLSLGNDIIYTVDNFLYFDYNVLLKKNKYREMFFNMYSIFMDEEIVQIIKPWYETMYPLYEKTNPNPILPPPWKSRFISSIKSAIYMIIFRTSFSSMEKSIQEGYTSCIDSLKELEEQLSEYTLRELLVENIFYQKVLPILLPFFIVSIYKQYKLIKSLSKYDIKVKDIQSIYGNINNSMSEQYNKYITELATTFKEYDKQQNEEPSKQLEIFLDKNNEEGIKKYFTSLTESTDPTAKSVGAKWSTFMSNYGMRGPKDLDIMSERFAEKPSMLVKLILYVDMSNAFTTRSPEKRKQMQLKTVESLGKKISKKDRKKIMQYYDICHIIYQLSQHHLHLYAYYSYLVRQKLIQISKKLLQEQKIDALNDIFYISFASIQTYETSQQLPSDIKKIIKEKKESFECSKHMISPRCVFTPNFAAMCLSKRTKDEAQFRSLLKLSGTPVVKGIVEGRAVVVDRPEDIDIIEGDILVAEHTDITYSPLFYNISGAIGGIGGNTSHLALMARDMNIPCVVNVYRLTEKITTGMYIKIDGNKGIVEILEEKEE
ncbi:hypothetical protein WA158_006502 [Blastocystis sp. Blastoise]